MKVGELITKLKAFDPDLEIVTPDGPILFLERLPAYWDGELQIMERDGDDYLSVKSFKITDKGLKVLIRTYDIYDLLNDDIDAPIELDLAPCAKEKWEDNICNGKMGSRSKRDFENFGNTEEGMELNRKFDEFERSPEGKAYFEKLHQKAVEKCAACKAECHGRVKDERK